MSPVTRRGALALVPAAAAAAALVPVSVAVAGQLDETPYGRVRRLGREFAQALLDIDESGAKMGATILATDATTNREPDFFEVGTRPSLAGLIADCDEADRALASAFDATCPVTARHEGRKVTRADRIGWDRARRRLKGASLRLCAFRCFNAEELHEKAKAIERLWSGCLLDDDEQGALLASMRFRHPSGTQRHGGAHVG